MKMQFNLLWEGREYYSLENCLVNISDTDLETNSTIIGKYGDIIYLLRYRINTNQYWETTFLELHTQLNNNKNHFIFEGDGKGNWLLNGKPADKFNGCIDVDIPLTPFTNTLPIKRLKLTQNEEQQIQVIYLNILEGEIKPAKQKYICVSDSEYHYENIPNDFEANISVDEFGLVVDYPSLFVRTAFLKTEFR